MAINLNPIPFYTDDTPYHYTLDNAPLEALEQNIILVKDALEEFSSTYFDVTFAGNLVLNPVNISVNSERNKPFMYRVKVWATSNIAQLSPQNSTLKEFSIIGSANTSGVITFEDITTVFTHSTGAALTITISSIIDNLVVNFSGTAFNTQTGFARIRVERFGI